MSLRALGCLSICVLVLGCGDDGTSSDAGSDAAADASAPPLVNIVESTGTGAPIAPATACTIMTADAPSPGETHLEPCSELNFSVNPPASGPHFSAWADYRTYDAPVPWGFLVHSMEHGGVVMAYNCPDGCEDVLSAFQEVITGHGIDPTCSGVDSRFIIVPDPTMDTPIAISAWEKVYRASCLDRASIDAFVSANYGNGPEDLCARGIDNSDRGWCE